MGTGTELANMVTKSLPFVLLVPMVVAAAVKGVVAFDSVTSWCVADGWLELASGLAGTTTPHSQLRQLIFGLPVFPSFTKRPLSAGCQQRFFYKCERRWVISVASGHLVPPL
jgi:hypothetical protein